MEANLQEVVNSITKSNKRIVLAITGGGTEAIGELLRHGGGSNVMLEAVVPYSCEAFVDFIGGKPDKFCDVAAARSLAHAAFLRGYRLLTKSGVEQGAPLVAIGATASLRKENEREGREHWLYIVGQTFSRQYVFSLDLGKLTIDQTRQGQEEAVAKEIIGAIALVCEKLNKDMAMNANTKLYVNDDHIRLMQTTLGLVEESNLIVGKSCVIGEPRKLICPGSFNPCHEGHVKMIRHAEEKMRLAADLEISVANVDKPLIDLGSMLDRLNSIEKELNAKHGKRRVWITKAPTFLEKARLFPCSTFIVGSDTFIRIGDPKYYHSIGERDSVLFQLHALGTRFLVYPRIVDGSLVDIRRGQLLDPELMRLAIVADDFVATDFASSQIRKVQKAY